MIKRLEGCEGDDYVVEGRPLFSMAPDHAAIRALAKVGLSSQRAQGLGFRDTKHNMFGGTPVNVGAQHSHHRRVISDIENAAWVEYS